MQLEGSRFDNEKLEQKISPKNQLLYVIAAIVLGLCLIVLAVVLSANTKSINSSQEIKNDSANDDAENLPSYIKEAMESYHDFPYIKTLWHDSVVVKVGNRGNSSRDVYVRFSNPSSTPELVDFSFVRTPEWRGRMVGYNRMHFAEQYSDQYDYVGRVWLEEDPYVHRVEIEEPEDLVDRVRSHYGDIQISEADITRFPRFEQWDPTGRLYYEVEYRINRTNQPIGYVEKYISESVFTPWLLVPIDQTVVDERRDSRITAYFSGTTSTLTHREIYEMELRIDDISLQDRYNDTFVHLSLVDGSGGVLCNFAHGHTPFSDGRIFYFNSTEHTANICSSNINEWFYGNPRFSIRISTSSDDYQIRANFFVKQDGSQLVGTEFSQPFSIQFDTRSPSSTVQNFSDPRTGVTFNYPTEWGPIEVKSEMAGDIYFIYSFSGLDRSVIFMAVSSEVSYPERGAFWGDFADQLEQDYLDECALSEDCTVFENSKGVIFAKNYVSIGGYYVDEPAKDYLYQLYNDNNEYYGITLSPERLDISLRDMFEEIVIDSFELVD